MMQGIGGAWRLALGRKALSTTMDADVLRELKLAAVRLDRPLNQLLDDGARKVLEEFWAADPDGSVFANRRDEPEEDLFPAIEARLQRYVQGYREFPETVEEIIVAQDSALQALSQEPWE
jgi:hypothetical protein